MIESTIVDNILDYLNSLPQTVAEKVHGSSMSSGKPDINGCFKGIPLRIEVKTPDNNNKASSKQKLNLKRWASAGAYCMIAYSVEDVKKCLKVKNKEGKDIHYITTTYCKDYGNGCIAEVIK